MDKSVTVSYDDLQAMYSDIVPHLKQLKELHENKEVRAHLAQKKMALPSIDWGSITGEICKDAPIVTKIVDFVDSISGWIPVAGVGAAIKVIDRIWKFVQVSLLPQVCPAV